VRSTNSKHPINCPQTQSSPAHVCSERLPFHADFNLFRPFSWPKLVISVFWGLWNIKTRRWCWSVVTCWCPMHEVLFLKARALRGCTHTHTHTHTHTKKRWTGSVMSLKSHSYISHERVQDSEILKLLHSFILLAFNERN